MPTPSTLSHLAADQARAAISGDGARRIESGANRRLVDWRELVAYRDLFWFLAARDIQVRYKQTVLGLGWAVLRPAFSMIVFSIVFGGLAGVPSDGVPYPLFVLVALIPWTYFATAVATSSDSLVTNSRMLTKVYFPRVALPLTPVLSGLVDFAIASLLLVAMMAWWRVPPGPLLLLTPLLVLLLMITATGLGLWLSALAVQYRDVKQANQFIVQLLMYAAPVVWPASLIAEKVPDYALPLRLLYGMYPMAGVIEGFRAAVLGTGAMPWDLLGMGTLSALLLLVTGLAYFQRAERHFADVA